MGSILRPEPFAAKLLTSESLTLSNEQQRYIREILASACSDSKFAEKAYEAIRRVLIGGSVVAPAITSLNPSSVVVGEPSFTLRVLGTGFTVDSKIHFNGGEEPTTYVSPTELTTGVNMGTVTLPVTVPVVVVGSDGVSSDPASFEFTAAAPPSAFTAPPKAVVAPKVDLSVKK